MTILLWSTAAMLTGFVLDVIFGDPHGFPHIVRWMGSMIAALDVRLRHSVMGGIILVLVVVIVCAGLPFYMLWLCYRFIPPLGYIIESFLCYQLLAAKSLRLESMKVYHSLKDGDIIGARYNLSMIVGRDTAVLDADGITSAAVETVAENSSDGITAPLLFIMLGGAALGCLYKAVNTMDSMVGYKNDKYLYFGRAAAKTDDVLNYIPARICAVLMIISAFILRFNGRHAYRIWRRDRRKHTSPNSAQTESVCAGALGLRLAGPISYFGQIHDKAYIGDDIRPITPEDIINANRLMSTTSILTLCIAIIFRVVLIFYA